MMAFLYERIPVKVFDTLVVMRTVVMLTFFCVVGDDL